MSVRSLDNIKAMKEGFMSLHNLGMSVMDIARMYEVPRSTAYSILQEIADANGVSREELLTKVDIKVGSEEYQSALKELSSNEILDLANMLLCNVKELIDYTKQRMEETMNG